MPVALSIGGKKTKPHTDQHNQRKVMSADTEPCNCCFFSSLLLVTNGVTTHTQIHVRAALVLCPTNNPFKRRMASPLPLSTCSIGIRLSVVGPRALVIVQTLSGHFAVGNYSDETKSTSLWHVSHPHPPSPTNPIPDDPIGQGIELN